MSLRVVRAIGQSSDPMTSMSGDSSSCSALRGAARNETYRRHHEAGQNGLLASVPELPCSCAASYGSNVADAALSRMSETRSKPKWFGFAMVPGMSDTGVGLV